MIMLPAADYMDIALLLKQTVVEILFHLAVHCDSLRCGA